MPEILQFQFLYMYFVCQICLVFFGIVYNLWIADLERKGHHRGFLSLIVALGCAVTVLIGFTVPTQNVKATLMLFFSFACSGSPMIIGSIYRFNQARSRDEQADEKDVRHGL